MIPLTKYMDAIGTALATSTIPTDRRVEIVSVAFIETNSANIEVGIKYQKDTTTFLSPQSLMGTVVDLNPDKIDAIIAMSCRAGNTVDRKIKYEIVGKSLIGTAVTVKKVSASAGGAEGTDAMATTAPLSDRFRLVCLSKEELRVQAKVDDYELWGAPALSQAQYQHKEALQRATAFSRRGSIFWALVERTEANGGGATESTSDANIEPGRDLLCVHCESHRFDCVFRKASGELVRGYSHHIGSVFTLPAYRKQGLASFFLREIAKHTAQLPDAVASVLYSEIGPDFYDRLGWRVYESTSAVLDALAPRNVAANARNGGGVSADLVGSPLRLDAELDALLARDNRRLEAEILSSAYAGREVFVPLATRDSVEWQFCIGEYFASILARAAPPPTQAGRWIADDAFVVWCHNHKGSVLNVVRARFPGGGQHDVVLALLRATLAEAQAFGLQRVAIWDPPAQLFASEVVAVLDVAKREHEDSLSSAMVFAQHRAAGDHTTPPVWLANEKFAWSPLQVVADVPTSGIKLSDEVGVADSTSTLSALLPTPQPEESLVPAVTSSSSTPAIGSPVPSSSAADTAGDGSVGGLGGGNSSVGEPPAPPGWSADVPSTSLLEATDAINKLCPPKYVAAQPRSRAIPTNNWWGNLIAHDKAGAKIQPVWANPYSLQVATDTAPFGLSVSYPFRSRVSGGSSGNSGAVRYYAHGILREMLLSASEFAAAKPEFRVVDWADQGVSIELGAGSGKLAADFVSGMAYASASYSALTPQLVSNAAILRVNGKAARSGDVFRGSKFEVELNSGQTWVVYALSSDARADKEIALKVDGGGSSLVGTSGAFDGVLRVALAVERSWVATLDAHRRCVVKAATVSIDADDAYSFHWKTKGECAQGLLHFGMAHHAASLGASTSGARKVEGMAAQSATRGTYQAYVAIPSSPDSSIVWPLSEQQPVPAGFYPERKVPAAVVQSQRILEHLRNDIVGTEWAIPVGGSYYFNGKAAQKYASLCLMANDSAIVGSGDKSLLQTCLGKLRTVLAPFVSNSWTHKLQYDRVYGGVVSSEGFVKNDLNADFGNTMYNDHHFHYGYWVHAAAIVNLLDPSWSDLSKLNAMAALLVRDVANFGASDAEFPRFRSFDWFRGHSYSHGVTPFADGKDQESSSEDVNFAFAMFLFGLATKDAETAKVGKLMTRVNARAIKTYFLMENSNTVHPGNFRPNKATGIFFDNKVDYATWFSAEKYCIHGIQMLPVSAVTPFVRSRTFVKEEWEQVLRNEAIVKNEDTGNAWLSLLYTNYAAVDKESAMRVLQKTKMDDGLTRSWAIYMAASFPE
ncbi:hypothetical protein PybrP1_006897 [[Pythium] brassicae (nom. inval.)]|nr:hypothetical protein PybrP1_006897 [[Pythium] brassicae (nom. inval.)]